MTVRSRLAGAIWVAVAFGLLAVPAADADVREKLHAQTEAGLRTIAFPVVPTVAAFLALGDVICAALFQTGKFSASDVQYVWWFLIGSTVGLLAATLARLYSSAFYALRDTRTPLRYATVRVLLTAALGVFSALWLPRLLHIDPHYGALGLTGSAGLAGWIEFALLRRGVGSRIGPCHLPKGLLPRLWASAIAAAAVGFAVKLALPSLHPIPRAVVVLGLFGATYLGLTLALGVAEASQALSRVRRLLRRKSGL